MEAYLGYVNFTLNSGKPQELNLKNVYESIDPKSIVYPRNAFIKSFTIEQIEVCSSSRGCTPKVFNQSKKQNNYLTVYKNGGRSIKTNKAQNISKFVLLNIKGVCRIGDRLANVAIRIPKTGVVGVKFGMSVQNSILVRDPRADQHIDRLGYEMEKIIYSNFPIRPRAPRKLSGMSIHGFNLHNPGTGEKPDQRISNFIDTMRALDQYIPSHYFDYQPRESKSVVRANFKPHDSERYPTFGITQWLTVDFSGVKSVAQVRDLSVNMVQGYARVKPLIHFNNKFNGPIPKSRRKQVNNGKKVNKRKKKQTENTTNVKIPVWNSNKKKFYTNDKVFNCMTLTKDRLKQLATKLNINPDGFKKDVCERINKKIKGT